MKPLKVLQSTVVTHWGGMRVVRDELELADGSRLSKHWVQHSGAVVIIPRLNDGRLLLVHQYRHAVGQYLLEFPAGTMETGEAPLACAQRELVEEVGHRAVRWRELGTLYPAPWLLQRNPALLSCRRSVPRGRRNRCGRVHRSAGHIGCRSGERHRRDPGQRRQDACTVRPRTSTGHPLAQNSQKRRPTPIEQANHDHL